MTQLWTDERISRQFFNDDTNCEISAAVALHCLTFMRDDYQVELNAAERRIAELEAQLPQMPQPDWSTAPEWAQWWAVDADSTGGWYEWEPNYGPDPDNYPYASWAADGGRASAFRLFVLPVGIDWRQTLTKRPEEVIE